MYSETTETPTIGFVGKVHLTRKGQVTVPKNLRQQLQMESGTPLLLLQMGEALLLLPDVTEFESVRHQIQETLAKTGHTSEEIMATLPEARQKVFEELYGLQGDNDNRP
jgi:AbrB family looped-hinge helix DNA binding protein